MRVCAYVRIDFFVSFHACLNILLSRLSDFVWTRWNIDVIVVVVIFLYGCLFCLASRRCAPCFDVYPEEDVSEWLHQCKNKGQNHMQSSMCRSTQQEPAVISQGDCWDVWAGEHCPSNRALH